MLYCKKCKALVEVPRCPYCGNKRVTEPKVNDEVYLATKSFVYARMLTELLHNNGIPHASVGLYNKAINRGSPYFNDYRFFVPYGAYDRSKELLETFIGLEE